MRNKRPGEIIYALLKIRDKVAEDSGCTKDKDFKGCDQCPTRVTCWEDLIADNLIYCPICKKPMLNSKPELIREGNLCINCYEQLQEQKKKP